MSEIIKTNLENMSERKPEYHFNVAIQILYDDAGNPSIGWTPMSSRLADQWKMDELNGEPTDNFPKRVDVDGIGARIKRRRKALGMLQDVLADSTYYGARSTISQIENGRRDLSIAALNEFADALDCSIEYLLGIDEGRKYDND